MALVVYNTLARRKEVFQPLSAAETPPGEKPLVRMYVCGVTVYDLCHLGHARTYVVWDTVRRYLEWRGYRVKYVQNFTDVDDKILKRALERGESMQAVAERFIAEYFQDMDRLNIKRADLYPRVTRSLPAIFELIQSLELKGFAYRVRACQERISGYDVYYAVRKFPAYGQLSGCKLEELEAGASGRVGEEGAGKRDPFDFALWKAAPPRSRGLSPLGAGGGQGGTSNALPWCGKTWGITSTSTLAVQTSSFPTTRTSWPNRSRLLASR